MVKYTPYILLFLVVLLLQIFVFDRLLFSTVVLPFVYITFILLLPIDTSPLSLLLLGAFVGVVFDFAMGMPGVNSIATILLSYLRPTLLSWIVGRDEVIVGGVPTIGRIGVRKFWLYISTAVMIHSLVLFSVEYINLWEWYFLLQRIIFSSAITIIFAWVISIRFEMMLRHREH